MLKRLPGLASGCIKTACLLPFLTAFAAGLSFAMPVPAVAGPAVLAAASANSPADEAGFARDENPPKPLTRSPQTRQTAQAQDSVEELAAQRAAAQDALSPGVKRSAIRLFGTVEFRGVLKNMPKWQRVVAAEKRSRTFDGDLGGVMRPASVYKQWQELQEKAQNASAMEKARLVTAFFNRWPYKTDQAVYKVADYWATPKEFLRNSGDCEDYAIIKFFAMMRLGVDPESMRVVALKDTIRNLAHAILVLYADGDAYVLDNLTTMVLPHTRYQHYLPQYSINEVYRWAHVRPRKK